MPLIVTSTAYFQSCNFNYHKMVEVKKSEVGTKLVTVNVGPQNFVRWKIFKEWIV